MKKKKTQQLPGITSTCKQQIWMKKHCWKRKVHTKDNNLWRKLGSMRSLTKWRSTQTGHLLQVVQSTSSIAFVFAFDLAFFFHEFVSVFHFLFIGNQIFNFTVLFLKLYYLFTLNKSDCLTGLLLFACGGKDLIFESLWILKMFDLWRLNCSNQTTLVHCYG